MYKHVLVPTDGSDLSERPLGRCYVSAKSPAQLTALHTTPLFYPSALLAYRAPAQAAMNTLQVPASTKSTENKRRAGTNRSS